MVPFGDIYWSLFDSLDTSGKSMGPDYQPRVKEGSQNRS